MKSKQMVDHGVVVVVVVVVGGFIEFLLFVLIFFQVVDVLAAVPVHTVR